MNITILLLFTVNVLGSISLTLNVPHLDVVCSGLSKSQSNSKLISISDSKSTMILNPINISATKVSYKINHLNVDLRRLTKDVQQELLTNSNTLKCAVSKSSLKTNLKNPMEIVDFNSKNNDLVKVRNVTLSAQLK